MQNCSLGDSEKVSTSEVKHFVRKLPNSKAIGIDKFPNDVYKKTPNFKLRFLTVDLIFVLNHNHVSSSCAYHQGQDEKSVGEF